VFPVDAWALNICVKIAQAPENQYSLQKDTFTIQKLDLIVLLMLVTVVIIDINTVQVLIIKSMEMSPGISCKCI
jgi:hypothetical protein